ncbi:hypothetical protein [Gordonia phthalatica]|uniref:Uncharacterized protein n=1 Tax=Gordonia phthalatica TaxID=1136941 RepID=A0A0N7FV14_9ACTN|nr:hypothetical protein [Gordonia phthalatica]ALG85887.1 hypothetical protein ACH46_17095 [Gordonia phthalatica]
MAKDSEPRARPITVSELIARSEAGGSAFPKSASEEDRRSLRRAGASGMPAHPSVEPDAPADEPGAEANAVTGIIPIVRDDDVDDFTTALEPVAGDDLVGVDLPEMPFDDETTTAVGDVPAAPAPAALVDVADDEPGSGHRRVASSADLEAAQEAEDEADAEVAKKARAAEKKAKKSEKESHGKSAFLGWLALLGEVVLGLAVGAGLFWGFTELWKRYVYLALILAVVVIFAIVTFAHVLRKRDLPTTLLALGVGMLVTIGPLVLLAA